MFDVQCQKLRETHLATFELLIITGSYIVWHSISYRMNVITMGY